MVVHHVEAARCVIRVIGETGQTAADRVPVQPLTPGRTDGGHGVVHLEADAALVRQGDVAQGQAFTPTAFTGHDGVAIEREHALALGAMSRQHRVMWIGREIDDPTRAFGAHGRHDRVCRVQHGMPTFGHVHDDHALEHGQVFDRGDVVQAQVVARAQVGHHRRAAAVKAQAFTQDAPTSGLQHGRIHIRVEQHIARTLGARAVAAVDLPPVHVHPIGVGHAHAQAAGRQQVGRQSGGGGLAVGTRDGHHRDAPIFTSTEHALDDGFAHGATLAIRRRQMHAQAGGRVDLDDATALCLQRAVHALGQHVNATDVQADALRRSDRAGRHLGVHLIGHIRGRAARGQVGVVAQDHALPRRRNGLGRQALHRQPGHGNVVKTDLGQ